MYDLLSECRSNVASNRARDCEAQPALLLEYSLSCRTGQGPCAVACVSRSLTPLGAKGDLLAGNKKSSFVATDASLFLIVCDRDSKMWLLEAVRFTASLIQTLLLYNCAYPVIRMQRFQPRQTIITVSPNARCWPSINPQLTPTPRAVAARRRGPAVRMPRGALR